MRSCARLLFVCLIVCAGCAKPIDLTTGLRVQNVSTGWFDAGIVNGQTKLVPSISFTLKNVSDQKLVALQINAVFRRVTDKEEWSGGVPVGDRFGGSRAGRGAPAADDPFATRLHGERSNA